MKTNKGQALLRQASSMVKTGLPRLLKLPWRRARDANLLALDNLKTPGGKTVQEDVMNVVMTRAKVVKFLGVATATLLLAACGDNSAEVKAIAKKMKFSKPEVAAFTTCNKDLGSKKPIFITVSADPAIEPTAVRMNGVPIEVCACQTRTIVKLFKEDKLAGHTKFVDYVTKQKRKPTMKLGRKDVKTGVDPEKGGTELLESLQACANNFKTEFAAREERELMDPYELPKKKVKKKKHGEGETEGDKGEASKDGHAKKPADKDAKKS